MDSRLALDIQLEEYSRGSPVIRQMTESYKPKRADAFKDKPAKLSNRQAVFLRNLITIAEYLETNIIPVSFLLVGRGEYYLDRGCIKIAEHAGFICPLKNGLSGFVEEIELDFQCNTP